MKRKIAGIFLFSLLIACGEADRVPRGVIAKEKMSAILFDMNLADTYGREPMDNRPLTDSIRDLNVKTYYAQVLQIHKISKDEFLKSYKYYENNPGKMDEVYVLMQDLVNQRKTEIDSIDKVRANEAAKIDPVRRDTTRWPKKDIRKMILP